MNPKFKVGDKVTFKVDDGSGAIKEITGTVYIVDKGTFMEPNKVSYDIMVEHPEINFLYKHITEEGVYGEVS